MTGPERGAEPTRLSLRRLWPLLLLAAGFVLFLGFGGADLLSLETLREHRAQLQDWVAAHEVMAPLGYMAAYAAVVAFSLPGATLMTVVGGFLFGVWPGTLWVVIGATVGATLVFLAARTALGDALRARAGPALKKMERGFRENALSYLLVLRLVPLFPFFLVNLVPAFLGVPLRTYVVATFLGIIPGAFVYAQVGVGLGSILDRGGELSPATVLTPQVLAALVGLALLALLPVAYKRFKAHGGSRT